MSDSKAPTPVPTTILETLFKILEPALFNYPDTHYITKALTEIETYYTTRLKKCIGEIPDHYTITPEELSTRTALRAEIIKNWADGVE